MKGMLRPAQTVMPASALEPEADVVSPPPNRFTHAVRARQPFYAGPRCGRAGRHAARRRQGRADGARHGRRVRA